jgi:hypothetical protein
MPPSVRDLIRVLPCRLSEMPSLRTEVADVLRATSTDGASGANGLLTETHFLLRAQQHLHVLNVRYFPQSGKSQQEVVAATAARVGLQMPKTPDAAKP